MNKPIRVYQCEDTPEGIFTAVYDAGKSRYGHDFLRIQVQSDGYYENMDLFSEYIQVISDPEKMGKVLRTVRRDISAEACRQVMDCTRSREPDKADVIYRFIVQGFVLGTKVTQALQIPCVQRMFEINRAVINEAHYYREFLRFAEIKANPPILLAVMEPKNDVLAIVTEHFADRLNPEWFIIYDKTHREAAFHSPEEGWHIRKTDNDEGSRLEVFEKQPEFYAGLWEIFFDTIKIAERSNTKLQNNNLPLHFRKHMTEFRKERSSDTVGRKERSSRMGLTNGETDTRIIEDRDNGYEEKST